MRPAIWYLGWRHLSEQPLRTRRAAGGGGVTTQFCAPYTVSLMMRKKINKSIITDGGFTVTDSNGTVVMQIRDIVFIFRNRFVLHDAAGQCVLTMQAKDFSMHGRWEVFRGDSTNARNLLFTAKRSSLWQLRTKVDVFLAGNNTEQVCDFKMKGGYSDGSCAFYLGNSTSNHYYLDSLCKNMLMS